MANISAELTGRIDRNRTRGKAARLYLRRNIATFPIGEIASLPRSTLKRIGIEPLLDATASQTNAAKKAAAAPQSANATATAAAPKAGPTKRPERIPSLLELLILGIVCIAVLTAVASAGERHARWLIYYLGLATGDQMGLCLRLDALTDDCSFEVKADNLSMTRLAEFTGAPLATLAAENPSFSPSDPLPVGAHVHIKRRGDQHE